MGLPYDDATAARLKGDLLVKDGGSWRYADRVWVKQSGTWRSSENIYVKSGGSWRDAAQYDVYKFKFTLNDNNNGFGNSSYNFEVQEKQSSGNNTVSGSANQSSSTFVLSSRLSAISSWSNNIAYGAIYVNSTQRYLRIDSLPAGSRVVLYINSGKRVLGRGGNGGNGSSNNNAGGNGGNGQTALYCRTNTILVNNGQSGVSLVNMHSTPFRASAVEEAIASGANAKEASEQAAIGTEPTSDINASVEYRQHLARVLVKRGLEEAGL